MFSNSWSSTFPSGTCPTHCVLSTAPRCLPSKGWTNTSRPGGHPCATSQALPPQGRQQTCASCNAKLSWPKHVSATLCPSHFKAMRFLKWQWLIHLNDLLARRHALVSCFVLVKEAQHQKPISAHLKFQPDREWTLVSFSEEAVTTPRMWLPCI